MLRPILLFSVALACIITATASLSLLPRNPCAEKKEESDAVFVTFSLEEALSGTVFFGESTTAHLSRTGGLLDTPSGRRMVFRDQSGTRMLDRRILSSPVLYPRGEGMQTLPFSEALAYERPTRIVLSFGLNGLRTFAKNTEALLSPYRILIDGIRKASPDTRIYLQSVYPVGENSVFSADLFTVNREIRTVNEALKALCAEYGILYLDTAALLADENGTLRKECDIGDGIHLTNEAYRILLSDIAETIRRKETNV